jgi:hypothetical protein
MIVTPITTHDSEGAKLHLTPGQEYEVLAVEGGFYRVLTDPESQPYGNEKARKEFEWQLKKYYPKTWQERYSFVRPG